jgi:hypothetical protein
LNRKIGVVAASNSSIYALTRQRGERKRKRRKDGSLTEELLLLHFFTPPI